MVLEIRPFQRRFLARAMSSGIDVAILSGPRGLGKTTLAAHIVSRALTPGDSLYERDREVVLISGSLAQSRYGFKIVRRQLEPLGLYRWSFSTTGIGAKDTESGVELRVLSSNPKTALGMVNVSLAVLDEPGSYPVAGGEELWNAVATSLGKPGSMLRVLLIGTIAPSRSGWWRELVEGGSTGSTYVQLLQGDVKKWDDLREVYRVNPLSRIDVTFRAKLRQERDAALRDPRLKARFFSYRLNFPTANENEVLLTVADWEEVCGRPVPERDGRSVIGLDMGASRSWSSAVAIFQNGRCEATAIAPGIPSMADQEKRDRVSGTTYARLVSRGLLHVDADHRVVRVSKLIDEIWRFNPAVLVCDRFRLAEVLDAVRGRCRVQPRVWQWSSASEDIRHLRRLAQDGPLSVEPASRDLLAVSLQAATVLNDTSGNVRLIKRGSNNCGRDDVAAALCLSAGEAARQGCEAVA